MSSSICCKTRCCKRPVLVLAFVFQDPDVCSRLSGLHLQQAPVRSSVLATTRNESHHRLCFVPGSKPNRGCKGYWSYSGISPEQWAQTRCPRMSPPTGRMRTASSLLHDPYPRIVLITECDSVGRRRMGFSFFFLFEELKLFLVTDPQDSKTFAIPVL